VPNRLDMQMRAATRLILPLILLLGLAFRLAAATVPRMNPDEGWSYYLCRNPVPQVLDYLQVDRHPPASYLWLAGWLRVVGHDEVPMRLPFVLLGTLAVGLTFLLGRELFDERVGLCAAGLYAVVYPAWEYDTWIRSYALLSPLSLLASWMYLRTLKTGSWTWGLGLVLSSTLLLYSHYLGFFVLAAHLAHAVWKGRHRLGLLALCWGLCALLYLPWLPCFLGQLQNRSGRDLQAGPAPALALSLAGRMMLMETGLEHLGGLTGGRLPQRELEILGSLLLWGLLLMGLGALAQRNGMPLLALLLAPMIIMLVGIALKFPELSRPRYYVFLIPYLGMLLGAGALAAGRWRPLAWTVLLLVGLVNLALIRDYRTSSYFRSGGWDAPARWIRSLGGQADSLAGFDNYALHPLLYYYAREKIFYRLEPRGFAFYEYAPDYAASGLLPVHRLWVEQVANNEIERVMEPFSRPVLLLWLDGGMSPVRQWFGQRYGVRDALVVENFAPDGVTEAYFLQRFETP
jgi:4-amino-4-deoxy-L-arabinose transferase-like glycosyltransferase